MSSRNLLRVCPIEKVSSNSNIQISEHVLGRVNYGSAYMGPVQDNTGSPYLSLQMMKNREGGFTEIWTAGSIEASCSGNLLYAYDDEYLFCTAEIPASDHCRSEAREAYLKAFELIEQLGYPQIFRMWNFIPHINENNPDGLEVYRDFCAGRAEAFERYSKYEHLSMPAATGIGTQGGNITFYFLACKSGLSIHLENPRQIPAYRYPQKYGPRSPSFARATNWSDGVFSAPPILPRIVMLDLWIKMYGMKFEAAWF